MPEDHFKADVEAVIGRIHTAEDARRAHHLATADPEVDGLLTGPEHEAKYGLERAVESAAYWRKRHADVDRDPPTAPQTADAPAPPETVVAPAPVTPPAA